MTFNRRQVIVTNIGTVWQGDSKNEALKEFAECKELVDSEFGRASGETVYLFEDGHLIEEHAGTGGAE